MCGWLTLKPFICWRGAMAAQLICNQQVVGSTPSASSNNEGGLAPHLSGRAAAIKKEIEVIIMKANYVQLLKEAIEELFDYNSLALKRAHT